MKTKPVRPLLIAVLMFLLLTMVDTAVGQMTYTITPNDFVGETQSLLLHTITLPGVPDGTLVATNCSDAILIVGGQGSTQAGPSFGGLKSSDFQFTCTAKYFPPGGGVISADAHVTVRPAHLNVALNQTAGLEGTAIVVGAASFTEALLGGHNVSANAGDATGSLSITGHIPAGGQAALIFLGTLQGGEGPKTFAAPFRVLAQDGYIQTAPYSFTIYPDNRADLGPCEPQCEANVGAPINITNGNTWIKQQDYLLPGLGGGLGLSRIWNSLWRIQSGIGNSGMFGHSWRSNLEERIQTFEGGAHYWKGDGSAWSFSYNSTNQTYSLTSPVDERATLTFSTSTTEFELTFKNGNKKKFNNAGYLIAEIDRNGNRRNINYDASNRITSVVDAAGRSLSFTYADPNDPTLVTRVSDSEGTVATYSYTAGKLMQVNYPDGSAYKFTYDAEALITAVTDVEDKLLEGHTYDSSRRGLTSVRANGVDAVTVSYPAGGAAQVTNSDAQITDYTYQRIGKRNFIKSAVGPRCASCNGRGAFTYGYDTQGNRTTVTDARGTTTTLTYDGNGNVTGKSTPVGNGTNQVWQYTYNSFGQILTATDPLNKVTTYTYDTKGNLLTVTTPSPGGNTAGSKTTFTYDLKGQLTKITDPLNHATNITYTPTGLVQTITDANSKITTFEYDGRGNRTAVIDALNKRTTFRYDLGNRLTHVIGPDLKETVITYDLRGRRRTVTDANLKATTYAYDDADRLTSVTDAADNVTQYGYDTESNLTSIIDAKQRTTTFQYDDEGRVEQTTFPSTLVETFDYDPNGNLISKTDRKNQTVTYAYDNLNRLTVKTYPDTSTVQYTYDLADRMTQVVDSTGSYLFAYDNMGRLTSTSTTYSFLPSRTLTVAYTYDAASNRKQMTDPEGGAVKYAYDVLNRLTTLTNYNKKNYTFTYDALSRRTQLSRPNAVVSTYGYDDLSRLLSVLHKKNTTVLDGASYTVDNVGNRSSKQNHLNSVTDTYGYDDIYQLLQVAQGGSTAESYTYDEVGNRLTSLGVPSYVYNPSNQLTSTSAATFTYDNNGNTLTKAGAGGTTTYTWDFENRLTSVVQPGGTVTFKYDPLGRRIQKVAGGSTGIYAYDGSNIIEELNQAGAVLARYIHGPSVDEPLEMTRSGVISYYQADGLGSITSLSSATGAIVGSYTYDAYGKLVNISGGILNPFRYTGREFDIETGLYYYRARYYDAATGRFINEDPISLLGGINLYAYTSNDPANRIDPLGLYDGWDFLRDVGTFSEAFADTLTFGSASRLNDALGAGSMVDRCSWIHTAGAASGIAFSAAIGGHGLPNALKGLPRVTKGRMGESLSIVENTLRGSTRLPGPPRIPGFATRPDSVWRSIGGELYYLESKFGTSHLSAAQRFAANSLGAAYRVEKWTYPFFERVGTYLGAGYGAAGATQGSHCGCN